MKCFKIVGVLIAALAVAGCGKKESAPSAEEDQRKETEAAAIAAENAAPVPAKEAAGPPKNQGTVDLTLSGAVERKLEGAIGTCGATRRDGKLQGGSYGVRSDDVELQVIALTDDELASPAVVLNLKGAERKSFGRRPGQGTVTVDVERGVTLDVELKEIVGTGMVRVVGTVTCQPGYR